MFFKWKRRQIKQNEKFSNFWENHLYRKAIAYDKIGGNYVLPANSIIICLLGYFCMQKSYLRRKQFKFLQFSGKMQKNRKMSNFGNFSQFFSDFHRNSWAEYQKKSVNMFLRWKRRQIKQNQKCSNFWENQFYRKAIAFDKIGGKYALLASSIKICLLGYFCMQNSYLWWKQSKILQFSWKMQKKKNRKMNNFGNLC